MEKHKLNIVKRRTIIESKFNCLSDKYKKFNIYSSEKNRAEILSTRND